MMIFNKQLLLNNLLWGENSRERNRQELGLLPAVFASPDKSRVWGTDHSGWDGNVNMNAVKANGTSFTFIKCMDGTVPSRYWLENRQRAIAAGLVVGDYTWLYPNNKVSCKAQAQAVWNRIKNEPKQLPLTVDFEWTRYMGQPAHPIYSDLDLFVTEFIRLSGYEPMVYSAAGYMNPMGGMLDNLRAKISHFWFANYGVIAPMLPFGFSRWDFWQFACTGDATVISPNDAGKLETDLNYWHSNLDSLRKLAGDVILPPITPLPTGDNIMDRYRATWDDGCNRRVAPNVNNTPVSPFIAKDAEFDVSGYYTSPGKTETQELWGLLTDTYWVALVYGGQVRAVRVDVAPPDTFRWPDRFEAQYVDAAGNIVANRFYVPE